MRYVGLLLLAFASVALVTTGCDTQDVLDDQRQSSDAGPGQGKWQKPADLDDVLSTGYWYMTGAGFGGESMIGRGYQMRSVPADVTVPYQDAGGGNQLDPADAPQVYGRQSNNPAFGFTEDIWTTCYSIIGNANEVIDFVENEFREGSQPFPDPDNQMSRIYGEALVMRALGNWNLATIFAPPYSQNTLQAQSVVIREAPVKSAEGSNKAPGTVEELYNLIESDLKAAIEELPETPANAPDYYNYSRFTKSAAEFLLARVSLHMQKWGQAQQYATEVIDDSKFDLSEDPIEAFNQNTFTRPNEVIWYFAYVEGNGVNQNPWKDLKTLDAWTFRADSPTQRFVAASYSFAQNTGWWDSNNNETTMAANDLRYEQLFEPCTAGNECNGFTFSRPTLWNDKFFRQGTGTNVPMFRLPEMYLTRALASFTGDNGASQNQSQALSDVNAVRQRAGLSSLSSLSGVQDIHRERMREMAFEGDRLWYLQANRVDIPNGDTRAGTGSFVIDGGRQPGGSVAWDSDAFVWPIPEVERETNTEID